jgi:hypothetical protein
VNQARPEPTLRVFYRDYVHGVSISSAQPGALAAARLRPLAERLLVDADNFLGVVDRNDAILQCYVDDDPRGVVLELVYPEASGCLRLRLTREEALQRLADLPAEFDEHLLPGAQYLD